MSLVDPAEGDLVGAVALPSPLEKAESSDPPSRIHLVVVTTRALNVGEAGEAGAIGATLRTRFWHPRDRRWSENDFESPEHARRLFVDESGWLLRQEQELDAPLAHEWIFEAHRIDFNRPTQEAILEDIGMTPEGVDRLLEQVDRKNA